MKKTIPVILLVCTSIIITGCANNKTLTAATIGAATGAILGKSTGNHKDKRAWIGAAVGALTGALAGKYMDAQEAAYREELAGSGIEIIREGDNIRLIMPSNITFAFDQSTLTSSSFQPLNAIAKIMKEYDKTLLSVDGFTDSTGDDAYNLTLSEARAQSVKSYLEGQGIHGPRMLVQGFGKAHPVASNDTAEGRALNRRVEIQIIPNTSDTV